MLELNKSFDKNQQKCSENKIVKVENGTACETREAQAVSRLLRGQSGLDLEQDGSHPPRAWRKKVDGCHLVRYLNPSALSAA